MSSPAPAELEARYTWGGDEFLFVEVSESMSLAANFRVMSIAEKLADLEAARHRRYLPCQRLAAGEVRSRRPAAVEP